jgi:hypothetical protein
VLAAGKLPLMLCFLAFVITFAVTRSITRLIRDGRGPFRNHVTSGGTHIHHSVPGLVLLIVGGFVAVGDPDALAARAGAGVAVGIGVSLVLDEFALILHLEDVYWSGEGQLSVQMVSITAGCLGLALVGFSPWGVKDANHLEVAFRLSADVIVAIDAVGVIVCVLKGKYRTALFGIFIPMLGPFGALRLGRPNSLWARHRYRAGRLARAQRRAAYFDRRWDPIQTKWEDFIGGTPSLPNPPPAPDPPAPTLADSEKG